MSLRTNIESYGKAYGALVALSSLFALGAVVTLLPWPLAPWPSILGYKSVCPFAPAATLACALGAAGACILRARLVRRWTAPAFVPVAALLLLSALLALSTVVWAGEKAKYEGPDAISAASSLEGAPGASAR